MLETILAKLGLSISTTAAKTGVDAAKAKIYDHILRERKRTHQFVLDAIGTSSCLNPYEPLTGFVTLETIERRIRYIQNESEDMRKYAAECGMPALDDEKRVVKIKAILCEMVEQELLVYHPPDRWKLA